MPPFASAFPRTARVVAEKLAGACFDDPSLETPVEPCDLARCGGTCCHDGAYLSGEEADVVRTLANKERSSFAMMGLELPERVVVYGRWRDIASGPKTATRPDPGRRHRVPDYPRHFPETSCVFLRPDSRCGLQVLAGQKGLPPWYFKPFTCWMHPLAIRRDPDGTARVVLPTEETDPQRFPDYDGFACRTHCGRRCESGRPAREILSEELGVLKGLAGEVEPGG